MHHSLTRWTAVPPPPYQKIENETVYVCKHVYTHVYKIVFTTILFTHIYLPRFLWFFVFHFLFKDFEAFPDFLSSFIDFKI